MRRGARLGSAAVGQVALTLGLASVLALGGCKSKGKRHRPSRRVVVTPPAPPADPGTVPGEWKVGETVSWALVDGGREVGVSWGRYVGPRQGSGETLHRFESRVRIDAAAVGRPDLQQIQERARLTVDARGNLRALRLVRSFGGAVELEAGGGSVRGKIAGRPVHFAHKGPIVLLLDNHVLHLDLLLTLRRPTGAAPLRVRGLLGSFHVVPVTIEHTAKGQRTSLGQQVTRAEDHIARLQSVGGGLHYRRETRPRPAPKVDITPRPPLRYARPAAATWTDTEVTFAGQGKASLAGTLSLPRAGPPRKPAVLFVSGTGLQDRHGFSGEIDVGTWQLLDALAAAGFVVLRMDDRGAGRSTSGRIPGGVGYSTLVDDARRALRFLAARREVDPARLYLVGHSEGALTAAVLAGEPTPKVRGLVYLAGPARRLDLLLRDQQQRLYWKNLSAPEAQRQRRIFDEITAAVREGRAPDPKLVPPSAWRARQPMRKWLKQHLAVPVGRLLGRVACPVLIAQGAKDFQVSVEHDAKAAAKIMRRGGNRRVMLKIFAGLDHLFKKAVGGPSLQAYLDRSRRVDRRFLAFVVGWLRKH